MALIRRLHFSVLLQFVFGKPAAIVVGVEETLGLSKSMLFPNGCVADLLGHRSVSSHRFSLSR
jgi:hypothetical protein